jgi:hypothetical protein
LLIKTFVNCDRKKVDNIEPRPCITKLITAVIYGFPLCAKVFVPDKPFQPSLMFVDKAGSYPSESPFRCSMVAIPTTMSQGWKGLPARDKHSSLLQTFVKYDRKKLHNNKSRTYTMQYSEKMNEYF